MIKIEENVPLKELTTFKVGGPARYFIGADSIDTIKEALKFKKGKKLNLFVLSGGSNILISDKGFDGLVIHINLRGFDTLEDSSEFVIIKVAAGENWDELVAKTVDKGWWGIENLSHIPGYVGSAAVQNIGAYGQEVSEVIESVEVFDTYDQKIKTLSSKDCEFSYRKSVFNSNQKGRYIILDITLKLSKITKPKTDYKDVQLYFGSKNIATPTQKEIRKAIISIRDSKFPFPVEAKGGNAGSFFKNLILTEDQYSILEKKFEQNLEAHFDTIKDMRAKFASKQEIKIPTAVIIDKLGLKGHQIGGAMINKNQPLVILNTGSATAKDVLDLFKQIRQMVYKKTDMKLVNEPELVGFTKAELKSYFEL